MRGIQGAYSTHKTSINRSEEVGKGKEQHDQANNGSVHTRNTNHRRSVQQRRPVAECNCRGILGGRVLVDVRSGVGIRRLNIGALDRDRFNRGIEMAFRSNRDEDVENGSTGSRRTSSLVVGIIPVDHASCPFNSSMCGSFDTSRPESATRGFQQTG